MIMMIVTRRTKVAAGVGGGREGEILQLKTLAGKDMPEKSELWRLMTYYRYRYRYRYYRYRDRIVILPVLPYPYRYYRIVSYRLSIDKLLFFLNFYRKP